MKKEISRTHSEMRVDLNNQFKYVLELNALLTDQLRLESHLPAWVSGFDRKIEQDWIDSREKFISLINKVDYEEDQKPGDTTQLPGVIAGTTKTLHIIGQLNESRRAFQQSLMEMDGIKVDDETMPLSKIALNAMGLSRINRKQMARKLIILPYPLEYAGFCWSRYIPSTKLTAEKIIKNRLSKLGTESDEDPRLAHDYRALRELNKREYLMLISPEVIHSRVNISRVESPEYEEEKTRDQKLAYAPIFYLYDPDFEMPRIKPLPEKVQSLDARKKRSDVSIEPESYLLVLRVHRYKPPQFEPEEGGNNV